MKRFITLSVLALSAWCASQACGPWVRPTYDVFEVYNSNLLDPQERLRPMYDYWQQYAGEEASSWRVDQLGRLSLDDLATTDNPIVIAARTRGDSEMLAYLRHLTTYLRISANAGTDTWDYPTREKAAATSTALKEIERAARQYTGTRLKDQYALLLVRSLVQQGNAQGVIDYWSSTGSKLPATVYKDMMRGLYAWSLIATGRQREATYEYADMGDMASIAWLVKDQRWSLDGIKKEYAADASSPTLTFLVQDYINSMASSLSSQQYYLTNYGEDADIRQGYETNRAELQRFASFAAHVLHEGKTVSPSMWQAAAGYAEYLLGNNAEALKLLDKARNLDGTDYMRDNARLCRLVASTAGADNSKSYQNYLLGELKWLADKAKATPNRPDVYGFDNNHYMAVLTNLTYDNLVPKYLAMGQTNLATALSGMTNTLEYNLNEGTYDVYINGDYGEMLDKLSAAQWIDYTAFLKNKKGSSLEQWLAGKVQPINENMVTDMTATKFMRQGRFAEAIPYLERVPVDYISTQGISRYMARRDYNVDRWFKRQVVDRDWDDIFSAAPAPVSTNQKLQYCRDVVALEQKVNTAATPEDMYRLASLYYQAGINGDCWYLTRYGHSINDEICYPEEKDFSVAAIELLRQAKSTTDDEQLKQKCLYALAFIPYGEPYETVTYDENYQPHYSYNYNSYFYKSMFELVQYYYEHQGNVAYYISHCDVVMTYVNTMGAG